MSAINHFIWCDSNWEVDVEECSGSDESDNSMHEISSTPLPSKKSLIPEQTVYPASISIDALMKAGQLFKPVKKNRASLKLEKFVIKDQEWVAVENPLYLLVETNSFSSGGFRNAFLGEGEKKEKWVIKTYNDKATTTITETLHTTVEDHTRKQIQMYCVARHLVNVFSTKVPKEFGKCFKFNRAYYTEYLGQPATVEEFGEGTFRKYVNNNGNTCKQPESSSAELKTIVEKAECLVHFSYVESSKKLMLLDLQGSEYELYDPEIATTTLLSENDEVYFCCGNLSTISIDEFNANHKCNKYCDMIHIKDNSYDSL